MYRAAFFDMDGTLIAFGSYSLAASTAEALEALRARGLLLFVATGRTITGAREVESRFVFDGYITSEGTFGGNGHDAPACPMCSKLEGVQAMIAHHGIAPGEIIAFGDSYNDLEMLRFAGLGIAMAEAPVAVRAAADYVTGPAAGDGIADALRHFDII